MFTSLSQIFKNNVKTHFTSELFCLESSQWESATYVVAMVTWLQWQP